MNIAPLTPWQRAQMINRLGEGLSARNLQTMHDALSDGHLRTCYEEAFHEAPPVDLVTFSFLKPQPIAEAA